MIQGNPRYYLQKYLSHHIDLDLRSLMACCMYHNQNNHIRNRGQPKNFYLKEVPRCQKNRYPPAPCYFDCWHSGLAHCSPHLGCGAHSRLLLTLQRSGMKLSIIPFSFFTFQYTVWSYCCVLNPASTENHLYFQFIRLYTSIQSPIEESTYSFRSSFLTNAPIGCIDMNKEEWS